MKSYLLIVLFCVFLLNSCGSQYSYKGQTHIVRKGETLFSIGWRYGKNTKDIAQWNGLGDGSLIYPGQVLRLYGSVVNNRRIISATSKPIRKSKSSSSVSSQPAPKWLWPTKGYINVDFGEQPGTGTGVLINGKAGQAIYASAPGRVVYAGSGLIGYGKLIILEHNDTYLSAYGYSASLLVKEGDQMKEGQKIATMGEGPERKPRLHFEIRRNGKPINPQQYLPVR